MKVRAQKSFIIKVGFSVHGREISTQAEGPLVSNQITDARRTVAYEARLLRALVLKIMGF